MLEKNKTGITPKSVLGKNKQAVILGDLKVEKKTSAKGNEYDRYVLPIEMDHKPYDLFLLRSQLNNCVDAWTEDDHLWIGKQIFLDAEEADGFCNFVIFTKPNVTEEKVN